MTELKTYRITVPMLQVHFADLVAREEVGPRVTLAPLDVQESARIAGYWSFMSTTIAPPGARLEILTEFPVAGMASGLAPDAVEDHVREHLSVLTSLLAVATRAAPGWFAAPIDEWSDERGEWVRNCVAYGSGRGRPLDEHEAPLVENFVPHCFEIHHAEPSYTSWHVDADGRRAWAGLVERWSDIADTKRLTVALQYVATALREMLVGSWSAMTAASIALEAMLGDNAPELSNRIALRAAHLGTYIDLPRQDTYDAVRASYRARSKLVHEGRDPDSGLVRDAVELIRLLLPPMAALVHETASHAAALGALDRCSLAAALPPLPGAWWRMPTVTVNERFSHWAVFGLDFEPASGDPSQDPDLDDHVAG